MTKVGDILMDGYVIGEIQLRMLKEGVPSLMMPDYPGDGGFNPADDLPEGGEIDDGEHGPPGGPRGPGGPAGPSAPIQPSKRLRTSGDFKRHYDRNRMVHKGRGAGRGMNETTRRQLSGQTAEDAGVTPEFPVGKGVNWKNMDAEYIRRANKAWSMATAAERAGSELNSGFRTFQKQQQLYRDLHGRGPVARPGTSMHELGGAGDWRGNIGWLRKYGREAGLRELPGDPGHFQLSEPTGEANRNWSGQRGVPAPRTDTDISPDATGSEYLRQERAWAKKELDEDPALKRYVRGVLAHEEGPGKRSRILESMLNRINALRANGQPNLSIREYLSRRGTAQFYGPIRRGEINERWLQRVVDPFPADEDQDIGKVLRGSNEIRGFTDQGGPGDPNYAREKASGEYILTKGGELYGDHNAAARAYRLHQQRAVQGFRDNVASDHSHRPRGPHVDVGNVEEVGPKPPSPPTLGPAGGFRPSLMGRDEQATSDINRALDQLSKEAK